MTRYWMSFLAFENLGVFFVDFGGLISFFKNWNKCLQKYLTVKQLSMQLTTSVHWCMFPSLFAVKGIAV